LGDKKMKITCDVPGLLEGGDKDKQRVNLFSRVYNQMLKGNKSTIFITADIGELALSIRLITGQHLTTGIRNYFELSFGGASLWEYDIGENYTPESIMNAYNLALDAFFQQIALRLHV
jgi:hypothetical protein